MRPFLSIIIPVLNEEEVLPQTLSSISEFLQTKEYAYEIIIIDDASQDNTAATIFNAAKQNNKIKLLQNSKNFGKGYSVRKGMMEAKGEYILFTDGDLSTPIQEIDQLMNYKDEADIVIGSRAVQGAKIIKRQPFYRKIAGKLFNLLVRILLVKDIKDTQCGFKLFKKEAARKIFRQQKINGYAFDVEILYLAQKNCYRIKEIPIRWSDSKRSHFNLATDSWVMFWDLIWLKIISPKA